MPAGAKICVVEDDESIRVLLRMALEGAGYETVCFADAASAIDNMRQSLPDAVLLDVMLPGMSGIEAMRVIRSSDKLASLPVMMLTALGAETDKVMGLDAGADDYMTKPFGVLELCARVRALLRRTGKADKHTEPECLECEGLVLDMSLHEAFLNGTDIALTHKEIELLRELMIKAPRAVPREELLQTVWGYGFIGETRTLDMHIGTLRNKLGEGPANFKYIKTVRGVGYRFVGEVTQC